MKDGYGKQRDVLAFAQLVMLKTMKCPVRVVWIFRKSRYVALVTTDLSLSVEQIIEYYGARWKIDICQPCCLHKRVFSDLRSTMRAPLDVVLPKCVVFFAMLVIAPVRSYRPQSAKRNDLSGSPVGQ